MAESSESFCSEQYEYEPTAFIKCHSRIKGDKNDRQTKVWMCAFEPHLDYPERHTSLVATCGSNSVCVIDVKTGEVITKHYSKDMDEEFYFVSWSTLYMKQKEKMARGNILAVGGAKCTLHLLHPEKKICFFEEKIKASKKAALNALQFHPLARTVLCGGFSNGTVIVWDVGEPSPPSYEVKFAVLHNLSIESINSEIFNMSFSRHCVSLLAATDNGVVAWLLDLKDVNRTNSKIKMWRFNFPQNGAVSSCEQLVDSVEPLQNGKMIATKCALYGVIYLWDLQVAIEGCPDGGKVLVEPDHILNYSKTDNYFMSMGSSLLSGLLCCGDDEGNIWMYDLKEVLSKSQKNQDQSAVIPWPNVTDKAEDSLRMLKLNEVVINKVIVSYNGSYIVAVTNTNLVCIWKKEKKI